LRTKRPGISAERIEDTFAPFRRLDASRGGDLPGVGLGLTIARDVIQSHGGTIELGRAAIGGLPVVVTLRRASAGKRLSMPRGGLALEKLSC
jgi:signal transduction histidine kinase